MPRKQRTPKTRADLPLSLAWRFTLLTGALPTVRLGGWVQQAQSDVRHADGTSHYDAVGDALWVQHGESLTREAASHGFVPYALTGRVPAGPGFERWQAAFIREHRY